jgi:hypothetical protein
MTDMHGLLRRLLPALLLLVALPAHLHAQDPRLDAEEQDGLCLDTTLETAPFTPPNESRQVEVRSIEKTDRRFDLLLQKINAATGAAKVDAVVELLAALVQDRRSMHESLGTFRAMMLTIMERVGDCEAGHFCRPQ